MSVFVSLSVIFLSALVHSFLALDLGGMLLLYHSTKGRFVTKKSRTLVSNYLLGSCLMIFLSLASATFLISLFSSSLSLESLSLICGILLALAVIIWGVYYRTGRSTELWLPRFVSRYISSRANSTSSRIEAFSLGMLTILAELPFSVLLFIMSGDALLSLSSLYAIYGILLYIFIALFPLLLVRIVLRRGSTIVDIQKWRVRNKSFLRILAGIGFAVLAFFIFSFKIRGSL